MTGLAVDLGRGLVLPNPVGLASGTAGYGYELRRLVDIDSLGALYTKGTTPQPRAGNPPPRVAETAGGMLNAIGLQNPGVDHVAAVYAADFRQWRVPVIVNVAGATVEDYVRCVERLSGIDGVAGIELNISCPNIAHGLDFGRDAREAGRLVAAVRAATEACLIVKLTPNVADIAAIARAVVEAGADAVSAVNTLVGMKVHLPLRRPVLAGRGTGGYSGPPIKPLALAAVASIRAAVDVPVIGIGGISTLSDALEFFVVGADAIQVGTATFVVPDTANQILRGLEDYLERTRMTSLSELRWTGP